MPTRRTIKNPGTTIYTERGAFLGWVEKTGRQEWTATREDGEEKVFRSPDGQKRAVKWIEDAY